MVVAATEKNKSGSGQSRWEADAAHQGFPATYGHLGLADSLSKGYPVP